MKIILSIILLFLSAQSFAIAGKGLLCEWTGISGFEGSAPTGYFFVDDKHYYTRVRSAPIIDDTLKYGNTVNKTYLVTRKKIYLGLYEGKISMFTEELDRKLLDIYTGKGAYREWTHKCELFNDHESLEIRMDEELIKHQKKYDEQLKKDTKDNKI